VVNVPPETGVSSSVILSVAVVSATAAVSPLLSLLLPDVELPPPPHAASDNVMAPTSRTDTTFLHLSFISFSPFFVLTTFRSGCKSGLILSLLFFQK
jgi:hypothetical protein